MKQISKSEVNATSIKKLMEGPCFEITSDGVGKILCIVGAVEGMRSKLLVLASQIDAMRGMDRKPEPPPPTTFDVNDFIKQID